MTDVRIAVVPKTVAPLLTVLVVFPSGLATGNEPFRIDLETDRAGSLNLGLRSFGVPMFDRILAGADQLSRFIARVPSVGQRHFAGRAETGVALLPGRRRRIPKDPGPISVLVDVEPQSVPVTKLVAGFGIFH